MRTVGALLVCVVVGCAGGSDDASAPAATDGQDLTSTAVSGLTPISPPELRATNEALTPLLGPPIAAGRTIAATRTLELAGKPAHLVVDLASLVTSVVADDALDRATSLAPPASGLDGTPYPKSLASVAALATTNGALESVAQAAPTDGASEPFALTIDMCQSSKPFEKRLFDFLSDLSHKLGHPIPIGISMSGGWAKAHESEFDQILAVEKQGAIAITWINHTLTHPLHCLDSACVNGLFLDAPDVDVDSEVLGLEQVLLARGLVPSVLFRFPGLVHDTERLQQLERFSLLPLDADAWIALGHPIKSHAVVLIHGNGNEPAGINGFFRQMQQPDRAAALLTGKSRIVPPLFAAPTPPLP